MKPFEESPETPKAIAYPNAQKNRPPTQASSMFFMSTLDVEGELEVLVVEEDGWGVVGEVAPCGGINAGVGEGGWGEGRGGEEGGEGEAGECGVHALLVWIALGRVKP